MIDKKRLSFGRYLKVIRIQKGISLEKVSDETKIRLDTLLLIEKEDHGRLPAEVFVKGFLRAYAESVGADKDKVIMVYSSSLNAYRVNTVGELNFTKMSTKFWLHLLLSLGGLICIIILSVFLMSFFHSDLKNNGKVNTKAIEDKTDKTFDAVSSMPSSADYIQELEPGLTDEKPDEKPEKKLLLNIVAIETTWLKVIIDDQKPKEYSLGAGDNLELEASDDFNLLIGNAAGVRLILNDKPVEVSGKSGQVVNINIP